MSSQRFVDHLRTQFDSSMMHVENVSYHGIPDSKDKYHFKFDFSGNHSQSAMKDFVKDAANDLSGGLTYEVQSVRRQTGSEYVFIVKISP